MLDPWQLYEVACHKLKLKLSEKTTPLYSRWVGGFIQEHLEPLHVVKCNNRYNGLEKVFT
ncbi:hypothetical protein KDI_38500 [Dictyobacter arantiisoli]|uniref:Uncharacterized protein n=1 Tax=Dictyobacter arantiisoli TaxID=2014874 RepID=A0A5A5TGL1_9CHLR|nr:hypothetical protein KDI_38500 [Dictyobacter arantiisoli]